MSFCISKHFDVCTYMSDHIVHSFLMEKTVTNIVIDFFKTLPKEELLSLLNLNKLRASSISRL